MQQRPAVRLHLELAEHQGTLTGSVTLDGAPSMDFTGWIGLNGAIDALLTAAQGQAASKETAVRTIIILHEVDDVDQWVQSTRRAEEFARAGATIREFVGPEGSNQIGIIAEISDEEAFQQLLQSDEAAEAMKADGVHPESLVILREAGADE